MIPLWLCNIGEDFIIKDSPKNMEIMTSDNRVFNSNDITGKILSVVGKDNDTIFAVFCGRRLAFGKDLAKHTRGVITGKTQGKPQILASPTDCKHCCANCGYCRH